MHYSNTVFEFTGSVSIKVTGEEQKLGICITFWYHCQCRRRWRNICVLWFNSVVTLRKQARHSMPRFVYNLLINMIQNRFNFTIP